MAKGDYYKMSEWLERMDKTGSYDKATLLRAWMLKKGHDVLKLGITIAPLDIRQIDTGASVLTEAERANMNSPHWDVLHGAPEAPSF